MTAFLSLGFLNPLLLWALPLAAVPIIIHLLNRRRFQTVKWAAMEFVLRAMKRNRRRIRMEHWLILLLRTLAVILLVLAVSRPRLDELTGIGGVRRHHVVLLDDSTSTAQRTGAANAFATAKNAVVDLVTELADRGGGGQLLTLLRSSSGGRPDLAATRIGAESPQRVRDLVATWQPTDTACDVGAVLERAAVLAAESEDTDATVYHLVTDARRADWFAAERDGGGGDNALRDEITRWITARDGETEHLRVLTVDAPFGANLTVHSVTCLDRVPVIGIPVTIRVEIENRGALASDPTEVGIAIDDRSLVSHPVPPLQPGERTAVLVDQTFHAPGAHGVTASLPEDRFEPDDVRALAFAVAATSRVLVVDGDPRDGGEDAESFFLNAALEVHPGVEARIVGDHELATVDDDEFAAYDQIWFCNVARIDDATALRLRDHVERGGGLNLTLGNQVDVKSWNDGLGALLPAPIVEVTGDLDAPRFAHLAADEHELFARYTDAWESLLANVVAVGRWFRLSADPNAPMRVLARVGDAAGDPLLAESTRAGGRVVVWTTTVDEQWTALPKTYAYQMLVAELHRIGARQQDDSANNLRPNEAWTVDVDPGLHRPDLAVTAAREAGAGETRTYTADLAGAEDAVPVEVPMRDLAGYGLFRAVLARHDGGRDEWLFSRSSLRDEGRLEQLKSSTLEAAVPAELADRVSVVAVDTSAAGSASLAGDGGTWRWLAIGLLIGLLLETVLAWRFGRR